MNMIFDKHSRNANMSKTCEEMPVPRAFSNAMIVKFAYYELSDNDWMNELYSQHIRVLIDINEADENLLASELHALICLSQIF